MAHQHSPTFTVSMHGGGHIVANLMTYPPEQIMRFFTAREGERFTLPVNLEPIDAAKVHYSK